MGKAKKAVAPPKVKRIKVYREISDGAGGIVRCEVGHVHVTYPDKTVVIMPPEVFAERHPELQ